MHGGTAAKGARISARQPSCDCPGAFGPHKPRLRPRDFLYVSAYLDATGMVGSALGNRPFIAPCSSGGTPSTGQPDTVSASSDSDKRGSYRSGERPNERTPLGRNDYQR